MPDPQSSNSSVDTHKKMAEARRYLYALKICDLYWFDGILPDNLTESFRFYKNESLPVRPPVNFGKIIGLDENLLNFICERLQEPVWKNKTKARGYMMLSDAIEMVQTIKR